METQEVVRIVASNVPKETFFVSSLGRTSEEVFRLFPHQTLFLDSMGDVSSVACGIALGLGPQHPVVAFDTDGSHLMGMTLLPSLASLSERLSNLIIIVMDNGIYESAAGLPSRCANLNWLLFAEAWGLRIQLVRTSDELSETVASAFTKLSYIVIDIHNLDQLTLATKDLDGIESKYRFVRHIEQTTGRRITIPAIKS